MIYVKWVGGNYVVHAAYRHPVHKGPDFKKALIAAKNLARTLGRGIQIADKAAREAKLGDKWVRLSSEDIDKNGNIVGWK